MIGRLLQSAASTFSQHSSSRPQTPLESTTEDAHTRDLLYPEVHTLRASQYNTLLPNTTRVTQIAREATYYDDRGGLDITYPTDIRIIIAQDVNSRYQQPQVLYDSRPPPQSPNSRTGSPQQDRESGGSTYGAPSRGKISPSPATIPSRRYHSPQSSMFQSSQIQPLSPISPRSPESRFRSPLGDLRPRATTFEQSAIDAETAHGKIVREGKEDIEALLGCMFGAAGFRIEPGTKLHVIPRKAPDVLSSGNRSPSVTRPMSSGGFSRRRTPLVRSTSVADMSKEDSNNIHSAESRTSQNTKPSIMFTRLFSVQMPESVHPDVEGANAQPESEITEEVPNTASAANGAPIGSSATSTVKQKKVPMYAVAIIVHLPTDGQQTRLRTPVSQHGPPSLSSSYNDFTPATSWRSEYSMFARYMEMRAPGSLSAMDSSLNHYIPHILTHWNIVDRALELLEVAASTKLRIILERSVPLAPLMDPPPAKSKGTKPKKPKQPTQQSIHVLPGCLQECSATKKETAAMCQRIISSLRTRRVVTGQARWGAWREEARWVGRWTGDKEQSRFLYICLTAFVGNHTFWIDRIASALTRQQRGVTKDSTEEQTQIKHRTVVVSTDKMAARRLIFLLSAFLPSTVSSLPPQLPASPHPSLRYSESPSSVLPAREQSLPRAANVNPSRPRRSGTNSTDHARSVSFSLVGSNTGAGDMSNEPEHGKDFRPDALARRSSDARSIISTTLAIPIGGIDTRKSSTSTIIADSTQPVPHFSSLSGPGATGGTAVPRPGSSGSLASFALSHTLKRSESSALSTSGSGGGRWGSMVSGFWSNRRGSSTDDSDAFLSSQEPLAETRAAKEDKLRPDNKLAQMVQQAASVSVSESGSGTTTGVLLSHTPVEEYLKTNSHEGASIARNIPRRPRKERQPLKLSVNEEDGYIDIEMPPNHSFSSSFASSFNSYRASHPFRGSPNEHLLPHGMSSRPGVWGIQSNSVVDVAGWLKRYHPDFVLQAVRPYEALKDEIKQSMKAEAVLAPSTASSECPKAGGDWTAVSTTLIADLTTFSIRRLQLLRRPRSTKTGSPKTSTPPAIPKLDSNAFDYEFTEHPIQATDPILNSALERVLSQSGATSRLPSRAPSPTRSDHTTILSNAPPYTHSRPASIRRDGLVTPIPTLEAPHSECRRVILGALEEIVKGVMAEESGTQGTGKGEGEELRGVVRKWLREHGKGDEGRA